MRHGIRSKVLMISLVPAALTLLLLILHSGWEQYHALGNALHERGSAIARQLAPACEYGVFSGNRQILQSLATATATEPDVAGVYILNNDGEILAYAPRNNKAVLRLSDISSSNVYRADIVGSSMAIEGDDIYGALPGEISAVSKIGSVIVRMDPGRTENSQNQVLLKELVISIIGLLAIGMLAQRLASAISVPITRLTQSVARIEAGELGHRVKGDYEGELGVLENGINKMALSLHMSREKDREHADNALYMEKVRAQVTLESISDGVITIDEHGRIMYMNSVSQRMLEWDIDDARGELLTDIFMVKIPGTTEEYKYPIDTCLEQRSIIDSDNHRLLLSKSGRSYVIEDNASPLVDRNGDILGAVVVFRDVTEKQHMTRRMEYLAHHDPLTGLINRREFEVRLQQALDNTYSKDGDYVVCFLDLDQFKLVNDACGHEAGDELLKQVAMRLSSVVRGSDVLARLGGDEFGLILEGCGIAKAKDIAGNIRREIEEFRFVWKDNTYDIGVGIGIVAIDSYFSSIADVLRAADSACYLAKDRGPNNIHVYSEKDIELAKRHGEVEWLYRLKAALETDGFELYCQGIEGSDKTVPDSNKHEVLLRLDTDAITPENFIAAAERYHLMPEIDRWVFSGVFSSLKELPADIVLSVNVSGQSLCDNGFLDYLLESGRQHNINWDQICIEITETAAIENLGRAQEFISRLSEMGCQFALDDFGSGLSSFGYLRSLPVDYLKIDGNFVKDLMSDPIDAAMVGGINEIGHVMGLKTIAEAVESDEIRELVSNIGVDYVQGYGVSAVVPLSSLKRKNKTSA